MHDPLAFYSTLLLNALTAVSCAALFMLVLWQNERRVTNQFLALMMGSFALYATTSFLFHFNAVWGLSEWFVVNLNATFYGLSLLSMCLAGASFVEMDVRVRRWITIAGITLMVISTVTIWLGWVFMNVGASSNADNQYDYSPLEVFLVVCAVLYLLTSIGLIRSVRNERSQALWPILLIALLDMPFNAISELGNWPHDTLIILLIAILFARLVMREFIAKPLIDINTQLAMTNLQLEQATRTKSQFVATVSHELRTPLNSIIGYTSLFAADVYGPLTSPQQDKLQNIEHNGRTLLYMINNILDLSRIEAGQLSLDLKTVDLIDVVTAVLDTPRSNAAVKGLALQMNIPPDFPPITADPQRLGQIIAILLSNAIENSLQGNITVQASHNEQNIVISVKDTGIGTATGREGALFDVYRTLNIIPVQHSSYGLGLTLVRHLVGLHHGQVWYTSDGGPGHGSTFYVALPISPEVIQGQALTTLPRVSDRLDADTAPLQ